MVGVTMTTKRYLRDDKGKRLRADVGARMNVLNAEQIAALHGTTVADLGLTVQAGKVRTLALVRALGY